MAAAESNEYEARLRKAAQAMQQMRVRLDSLERMKSEPIAIVGMACRLPGGVETPAAYWDLLRNGVDAISEVPANRWDSAAFYDADPLAPGKAYTRSGGFLNNIETFDAEFFGIAPREAASMDPQQRMLLELSWEALEAAGQRVDHLAGSRTGVFVGISASDYSQFHVNSGEPERIDAYSGTGVALSIAAGRLSYVFGFQGPNAAIDTFCSSSLVAIHLACQSLRRQESDMALAGGVNLILSPAGTVYSCKVHALSPDGRCKTFDASADGYGRGEGCGILVLKRLSDATAAGDNIVALIRGTAINHDGKSSGLTVPNGLSQQAVIRAAHADAGIDAAQVSYVEAHGTGTPLGDPIELRALAAAAAPSRTKADPLLVGSAKTNIGHLEAAAGVAGVIKVALALGKREIPAHLHLNSPNPHVAWDTLPIEVPTKARAWQPSGKTLVAGVSSFGFSGTNAHAVLEEAPAPVHREPSHARSEHILPLSAKTPGALTALVESYRGLLSDNRDLSIHDLCYSASLRRSHHEHRAAFVGKTIADLAGQLNDFFPVANTGSEDFAFHFPESGESLLMTHAAVWKSWGLVPVSVSAAGTAVSVARWFTEEAESSLPASPDAAIMTVEIGARPPIESLAKLYVSGVSVDWARLYPSGNLVALPSYPWQRKRFWLDNATALRAPRAPEPVTNGHPLLGRRILSPALTQKVFETTVSASSPDFLKDHRVQGHVLFPASAYAEMFLAAVAGPIRELSIREPLVLSEKPVTLQTVVTGEVLQIFSLSADGEHWKLHASASPDNDTGIATTPSASDFESRKHGEMSGTQIYEATAAIGLQYGAAFRGLQRLSWNDTEAVGEIELAIASDPYTLHPALFDSCLQVLGAKLLANPGGDLFLPSKVGSLRVFAKPDTRVTCRVSFAANPAPGTWQADMQVLNADGRVAVAARGIVCRQIAKPATQHDLRYTVEWREKESSFADEQGEPALWVVLADDTGLAESVCRKLRDSDQRCITVRPGDVYTWAGDSATINPDRPEDFRHLIQDALGAGAKAGLGLAGFVHMWALDEADYIPVERAVESAFHAAQAIGRAKLSEPPKFCVVTRGGQALVENAPVSPYQTSLAGLVRIVRTEHPNFHAVLVDLPNQPEDETQFLFEELLARNPEDLVAFRKGTRYVPRLQREKTTVPSSTVAIKENATYLITGGLGALGLQAAQWLAGQGARHLALVSRGDPSLGNSSRGNSSDAVRESLRTLELQGVDVKVLKADAASLDELSAAFAALDPSAPLAGVIHAAGSLDDGLIVQQNRERFSRVLAGKTVGARNLHVLTKHQALDFFILYSSSATLLGGAGQVSYATANAFLDGLACHRRALGLPAVSIAWGAWSGAGMAARLSDRERRLWADQGIEAIAPAQGLEELGALLHSPSPCVAVLKLDWKRFARQYPTGGELPLLSELAREARLRAAQPDESSADTGEADARGKLLRRLEECSPAERPEILADFVRGQVNEVLGFASSAGLDPNQGFFEIGMDSLMAVDLQRRLQNGLGITLSSTIGFDHPTVEALAKHLAEKALSFRNTASKPAAKRPKTAPAQPALEEMSEDQLVALLSKELDRTDEVRGHRQ